MIEFASESKNKIIPALIKAHQAFPPVLKDSTNPHFKNAYASLNSVLEAVNKTLLDNGLVISQCFEGESLRTVLYHESGEYIAGVQKLLIEKQNAQGYASASTYARRYGILAILNLAAEDDDGQASVKPTVKPIEQMKEIKPIAPTLQETIGAIRLLQTKLEKDGVKWTELQTQTFSTIDTSDMKTASAVLEKLRAMAGQRKIK